MIKYGYIKMPRSLNSLPLAERAVMYHLCTNTYHCATDHPTLGELPAWTIVSSRSQLCEEIGLTEQQLRTAIRRLQEREMVVLESTNTYSKLTITWVDFLFLQGCDIMLNNQATNQATNQVGTSVCSEISDNYSDKKNELTKQVTKQVTNNNIKIEYKNINTHSNSNIPGINQKRACAYTSSAHTGAQTGEVEGLRNWIVTNVPEIELMAYPFTPHELAELLRSYSTEDIHRILLSAWSKGGHLKHRSAAVLFRSFAERDFHLKDRVRTISNQIQERLYTYDEVLEFVHKNGISTDKAFSIVPQPEGKPLWRRIIN